jgi:2,4-dienoyl-CoA reductase-like NADH-dependent reductase (Old Yellow Enzyme family)
MTVIAGSSLLHCCCGDHDSLIFNAPQGDERMNKLFSRTHFGPFELNHRVILAPLTRMRTEEGNVPGDLMVDYYAQHASEGGLLITDATAVSPLGIAYVDAPGIYTLRR